ncbi:MAG: SUF system NifU family Fe-S cluster assembly protein [Chloroflexi bacterium]|nr:MAG: SUF system NifU family Fe-S cluster assembly protein [Phototrophicales bacterium]RMF76327.1 MAG: SUF system NifU family Fe-S cluster assembly protein [Chloroflexota bacterium]
MYDMYRENILDHAQNPRHHGLLENATIDHEEDNPLCGDHIHLTLRVSEDGTILEAGWEGDGCAISQASASMLTEEIVGKTLEEVRAIDKQHIFDMLGIPLSMNRVKCALLSLKVLKVGAYGLADWQKMQDEEEA